ncbi:MAG TPA: aspartate/glutamate racemase family protein [Candidatus Saccharimonadales bacterium]|nr:aspartate/glutamate racemase family protein [Candidatus Saccharimonadales bacterium]
MPKIRIGVFDSGVGAQHVVNSINHELPEVGIVYKDDKRHVPYGSRGIEEIHSFVKPIFQEFIDEGCQVIVVACNTVTTNLISELREEFHVPMVGMEPAVKPAAAATKSGVIAVCATPRTLSSVRYAWLKKEYATDIEVIEPDCADWALMIENNRVEREKVAKTIEECITAGADQIVLGCTHYHWIEALIKEVAAGRAVVIQPEGPVIKRLKTVLEQLP